jgi:hypothetical protein
VGYFADKIRQNRQHRRSPDARRERKLLYPAELKTGNIFLFSGAYCGFAE